MLPILPGWRCHFAVQSKHNDKLVQMKRVGPKRETIVFCYALFCYFCFCRSFLILILTNGRQTIVQILTRATAFTAAATEVIEMLICDDELLTLVFVCNKTLRRPRITRDSSNKIRHLVAELSKYSDEISKLSSMFFSLKVFNNIEF